MIRLLAMNPIVWLALIMTALTIGWCLNMLRKISHPHDGFARLRTGATKTPSELGSRGVLSFTKEFFNRFQTCRCRRFSGLRVALPAQARTVLSQTDARRRD